MFRRGGITMEYKVGEIFELDGKYYQVVEDDEYDCKNCSFDHSTCWQNLDLDSCMSKYRHDNKNVNFKLVDIGEIYEMLEELGEIVWKIKRANPEQDDIMIEYYNQIKKIEEFIANNYERKK